MSAAITIRRAGPSDAAVVLRFVRALATYEREPNVVEATVETLASQLADERPPFECLIADVNGEPAGFALYFPTYSTWRGRAGLWLEDLFVAEERRGLGVGRRLFDELRAIARARGYARIELAVLDWNAPTIERYRQWGGEALGGWGLWRFDP